MPAPKGILTKATRTTVSPNKVHRSSGGWRDLDRSRKVLVNPDTIEEAGRQHFERRDRAEVDQILHVKILQEVGCIPDGAVVTQGAAREQLILANRNRVWTVRPPWMPIIDGEDTRVWAHVTRLQPMINAIPIQAYVPPTLVFLRAMLTGRLGEVGQMTRMHNWVNTRTDSACNPDFLGDLNALVSSDAPITRDRVIAIQQRQRRIKIQSLQRALSDVRKWAREGLSKEENAWRERLVLEELAHCEGPLMSEILPREFVAEVREFFQQEFSGSDPRVEILPDDDPSTENHS